MTTSMRFLLSLTVATMLIAVGTGPDVLAGATGNATSATHCVADGQTAHLDQRVQMALLRRRSLVRPGEVLGEVDRGDGLVAVWRQGCDAGVVRLPDPRQPEHE